MEIKRTYEIKHHEPTKYGTWDNCKSRYRLSLNLGEDDDLIFEYEKFKVGFGGWEVTDGVSSTHQSSSYLWNDTLHPTWDEMSLKENELKEEFIRHHQEQVDDNESEIEWLINRNRELNDIIQGVKCNYIKKHKMV